MTAAVPDQQPAHQPERQVEVQLGHLCNNRCVFCVSGQLSEQKRAPQLAIEPILREIRQARAAGAQRITLLGGEPTIQRGFADILAEAVALDFDEVVIFTNGVMTPRDTFRQRVFEILARLGPRQRERTLWRFSLQGGDQASHDGTTLNPGAWLRILSSIETLHGMGARLSGNMCVVESNYRSIPALAAICQQFHFENLHLDMVRPRDSGDRTDDELRAMMGRYTDMAPYFKQLADEVDQRLGPGWDLNFGNVPFCTMPAVAHRIHHDGQDTVTVAADGQGNTQSGFDKYEDKRTDKHKPASCAQCVFDGTCSGVFDKYRQFYGDAEFVPITATALQQLDTAGHHFVRLFQAPLQAAGVQLGRVDERAGEIEVVGQGWRVMLRRAGRPTRNPGWHRLVGESFEASLLSALPASPRAIEDLAALLATVAQAMACNPLPLQVFAAVRTAWTAELQRRAASAEKQRWLTRLVERLQAGLADGWLVESVKMASDTATLQCARATDAVELTVGVAADDKGRLRPTFAHRAADVGPQVLADLNRALGQALRVNASNAV